MSKWRTLKPIEPSPEQSRLMQVVRAVLFEKGYRGFELLPETRRHPAECLWIKPDTVVDALIARFVPSGRIIIRHFRSKNPRLRSALRSALPKQVIFGPSMPFLRHHPDWQDFLSEEGRREWMEQYGYLAA